MTRPIAFRPDPELERELDAYAAEIGLSPGQAARALVETALGVERGKSPKKAALRAAVKEAVWSVARRSKQGLVEGIEALRDQLETHLGVDE